MRSFPILALFGAALTLAACKGSDSAPPPANTKHEVAITDARLVLPVVSGTAAATYFTIANGTEHNVRVVTIDIKGAEMAMMHETIDTGGHSTMQMLGYLDIAAHGSVSFTPGGKHVMVTGLSSTLKPHTTTQMTLTFDDGDKAQVALPIVSPAEASGN